MAKRKPGDPAEVTEALIGALDRLPKEDREAILGAISKRIDWSDAMTMEEPRLNP